MTYFTRTQTQKGEYINGNYVEDASDVINAVEASAHNLERASRVLGDLGGYGSMSMEDKKLVKIYLSKLDKRYKEFRRQFKIKNRLRM